MLLLYKREREREREKYCTYELLEYLMRLLLFHQDIDLLHWHCFFFKPACIICMMLPSVVCVQESVHVCANGKRKYRGVGCGVVLVS